MGDPKIRVGFIGCGGIMNGHVQRLEKTHAEIVALSDPSAAALDRIKARHAVLKDVPTFEDWKTMLNQAKLDAVIIGSPHTVHFEQSCTALNKGLHVLSEKPMVCTSAHARELIKLQATTGKVFGISYQRHFQGTYRFLKQLVQDGLLGEVQYVQAYQAQEWLKLTKGTWRQTQALSGGGQLNDSGSHLLDMVMWTTGLTAAEVSCRCEFFGTEVDINSAINVKFTNGALGTISVVGNASRWHEDFTIIGSKGSVYNRNGKVTWQQGLKEPVLELASGQDWMDPNSNFIEAIRGNCEIGCPPEIGLRVIELTEAAWRSHERNGIPVKVEQGA